MADMCKAPLKGVHVTTDFRQWMQGNSAGASTVSDLFAKRPTVRSPVSGYHVVAGSYPLSQLQPGTTLPTVDVVRNSGQPDTPVTLQITAPLKVCSSRLQAAYWQLGHGTTGGRE